MTPGLWPLCLHEAAHAVAAVHLLDVPVARATIGAGWGVADTGADTNDPPTFRAAVVSACGSAAERLARLHPPPPRPPRTAEGIAPATARGLAADVVTLPTDDDAVARWCLDANRQDWRTWRRRLLTVRWAARQFVNQHAHEIVAVARRLYSRGVVSIGRETDDDGWNTGTSGC